MINLSSLNENQLARIYIVANTPSYLFRHFRIDPSVQRFAQQNTARDLLAFSQEIAASQDRTMKQVVQAYAALVAISFKQPRDIEVDSRLLSGLNWASDVLALGSARKTTTAQTVLNPTPDVVRPQYVGSRTSSQYTTIKAG